MSKASKMNGEMAEAFASAEFERRHKRSTWPEWLTPCTMISYRKDERRRFVVSLSVSYDEPLREEEHREERPGGSRIIRVDPKTNERSVVFRTPRRSDVYFEAVVDPATAQVTVLIDRDLSTIEVEGLLRDR